MSIHEVEKSPSGGTALVSIHDPTKLCVDQVIEHLFPWPAQGQVFLARFKERAATERSIIPDLKAGDVVICTKSIATLAEALGLAYDTVQKYVTIFKALGMLQKRKFLGEQIAFILSLGTYLPPRDLEANLDYLLQRSRAKKSRTKYRNLVQDVKERCMIYGLISQEFTDALQQLLALVQPPAGISRSKLEQRLAQAQHLVSTMIARAMTARLPREDPLLTQNLPGVMTSRDAELQKQESESTRPGKPGRFIDEHVVQNLSEPAYQADSEQVCHDRESTQPVRLGRRQERGIPTNLSADGVQVDSPKEGQTAKSTHERSTGGFEEQTSHPNLPPAAEEVDSSAFVLTLNVNVITLISNITSNVQLVATFCRKALAEPPSKQRIYLKLFRECEFDAQAVAAALLFTLAHRQDGTMHNPASVFVARCRDYHTQGVSDEAAALVKRYGSLSPSQLLDTLQQPTLVTHSIQGTAFPTSLPHATAPPSLPPLPRWGTIPRLITVDPSRSGMSRQEALQVVACAQGDRRTKMCRVDLERLSNDTYAVLLDNTITTIPRQTYFYSLSDWGARTATIKDCFELFGVAPMHHRSWADLLKERGKR